MTTQKLSDRPSVVIPVTVQICDPESKRPLTESFDAVAVDINHGGVHFELPNVPKNVAQVLGPDIAISATFDPAHVKLRDSVYMNVTWFHPRADRGAFARASMGAYFTKVSDADRGALLRYATARQHSPGSSGRLQWAAIGGILVLLVVAMVQQFGFDSRVDDVASNVQKLRSDLEQQKRSMQLQQERADQMEDKLKRMGSGAAPERPSYAPRIEDGDRADGRGRPLPFKVELEPDGAQGVEVLAVELLQNDFVGMVRTTGSTNKTVGLTLDYPCDSGGRCTCEIGTMTLRSGEKTEFACTPSVTPTATLSDVLVRVRVK